MGLRTFPFQGRTFGRGVAGNNSSRTWYGCSECEGYFSASGSGRCRGTNVRHPGLIVNVGAVFATSVRPTGCSSSRRPHSAQRLSLIDDIRPLLRSVRRAHCVLSTITPRTRGTKTNGHFRPFVVRLSRFFDSTLVTGGGRKTAWSILVAHQHRAVHSCLTS